MFLSTLQSNFQTFSYDCYARVYARQRCPGNLHSSFLNLLSFKFEIEESVFAYSKVFKSYQLDKAGHLYWFHFMSNPLLTCQPKALDFFRSQRINIIRLKLAYKWRSGSLTTTFTSLARFSLKHGATVVKGLEELFNIQLENILPKLLFASNTMFTICTR